MKPILAAAAFLSFVSLAFCQNADAVLARMDQSAPQFHGMSADLRMLTHTAILDDDSTETGTLKMQRTKNGTEALIDFTGEKNRRTIGFFNKTIQLYFPNLNLVQIYRLGKKANLLDQFLLLGFGTSGKDLTKAYEIQFGGTEQILGQSTSKLILIPKEASMKEQLNRVEIWIPADSGYPVQQKFYNPSGNFRLVTYTNFKLNPPLGSLKLAPPANAKVEYPQ